MTLNLANPPLRVFAEPVPVFNLVPAPGEPARFGLEDTKVPIILDTAVRSEGDYGVTVTVSNATQAAQLLATRVTLWGEPQAATHDQSRGWACLRGNEVNGETCTPPAQRSTIPFLTMPTSCPGELQTSMSAESWAGETDETAALLQNGSGEPLQALEGCPALGFTPTLETAPVASEAPPAQLASADTPAGFDVSVALPVEAGGLGESAVRSTTVTLPRGLLLSPAAANGLQACSEQQIGFEGQPPTDPLAPGVPEPLAFTSTPAECPEASKVGLVRIKSPDLADELVGGVYLAAPAPVGEAGRNPFDSLIALYVVAEDPAAGVRVKLAGEGSVDEQTGQIKTTFQTTPEVPLQGLRLHLFEGPRASLSTPALCGSYTSESSFVPWSASAPATPTASFQITAGPAGSPCASPLPFAPLFSAGSAVTQAGAFTSFTVQIERPDGQQQLSSVAVQLPSGIAALISTVTPCHTPAPGGEWACGPESRIGDSLAAAGLGSEPYKLPGSVYLTEGYGGAPFGLIVVTPAVAGPFDLGNVVVRSKILVNPTTAAVTIASEPLPQYVRGIPVQLKQLEVNVDRPGFEFNPTSCAATRITATLGGAEGASSSPSTDFQAQNCAALAFHPQLTASAGGHASKANGTSFQVKVTSQGLGVENIAKVDLAIPGSLPSRQSTLKKACPGPVFEANPAGCSDESVIGMAVIHTPVLRNPLSGPAYLVSHGNAAFPDVEFLLQGEGITLLLDGATDIKKGVTYSRFESAPDAPFTTFETTLPAGPHSALTAYANAKEPYNLCSRKLTMPTEITAQDGAVIKQSTDLAITGCKAVASYKATRSAKLKKALASCRKRHRHERSRRQTCERHARKRYGAKAGSAHRRGRRA